MCDSPFDEAVARPLLNEEPTKKRWIWGRRSSREKPDPHASFSTSYRSTYSAPPIQEISFTEDESTESTDEELGLLLGRGGEMELETVDTALMRERHEEIQEVTNSMRQINEIQKDLALVVEEQQEHVNQFQEHALEALDRTSGGLSQLLRMQHGVNELHHNNGRMVAVAGALVVVVGVHWTFSTLFA